MTLSSICNAQSLRDTAQDARVLIGTAVRPSQFFEGAYALTLAREFNMVEPEDAMKWRSLRPDRTHYDFEKGDEVVRFAEAHSMKIRGHCLVWGRDNPEWLAHREFTRKQLSQLLRDHIFHVMKHYAGKVFAWDVVNEALDENGKLRNSIWYNQPGIRSPARSTAYIEQVFRWAHRADPKALLFYNDAEGESLNRKSDAIYALAKDLKRRGVPIDGIGLQMHVPALAADIPAITANIARLAALGLQIHITELDVSLPLDSRGLAGAGDLELQAEVYRGVVRACLSNPSCTAIETWGFSDRYSWIGSHTRGTRGQALLFDRVYQPKSAYRAVSDELSKGRPIHHGH